MGKAKKHNPEQIVNTLWQVEVASANGKTRWCAKKLKSRNRLSTADGRNTAV